MSRLNGVIMHRDPFLSLQAARTQTQRFETIADLLTHEATWTTVLDCLASGRLDKHRLLYDTNGLWMNVLQSYAWVNRFQRDLSARQLQAVFALRELGIPWVSRDETGYPGGCPLSPLQLIVCDTQSAMKPALQLVHTLIAAGDRLPVLTGRWPELADTRSAEATIPSLAEADVDSLSALVHEHLVILRLEGTARALAGSGALRGHFMRREPALNPVPLEDATGYTVGQLYIMWSTLQRVLCPDRKPVSSRGAWVM